MTILFKILRLGLGTLGVSLILGGFLIPFWMTVWISFSPDSFLTPPTEKWSLRWYEAFFRDVRWQKAMTRSLLDAGLSAAIVVLLGLPLAYAVARYHFRGKRWVIAGMILPGCLPPVVLGLGLFPILALCGMSGFTLGIVLTHALLALPMVGLILQNHLEQIPVELEQAAQGLGASFFQTAIRITLPLAMPAIVMAAILAAVLSFNEAMVTIFLTSPSSETIPTIVWPQLRYSASPLVAVASCLSIGITVLAVYMAWAMHRLFHRIWTPFSR